MCALWHLNTGMTRPIPAAVRVTLGAYMPGAYFYHGQVANLRIYSRALAAEEIARDIDDDRTAIATFRTSSPLDFYLRDADDQDVLYIDDDPQTDNLRLGIIDEVLPEPLGGAHRNPLETAQIIKESIQANLARLAQLSPETLVAARYAKFRAMGMFEEVTA